MRALCCWCTAEKPPRHHMRTVTTRSWRAVMQCWCHPLSVYDQTSIYLVVNPQQRGGPRLKLTRCRKKRAKALSGDVAAVQSSQFSGESWQ